MAKLSARGRTELARYTKESTDAQYCGSDVQWRRKQYAFMSDGHVLMKDTVRFNDGGSRGGELYSWPWKDQGNLRVAKFGTMQANLIARGFAREVPK